jgi:hypothetical protein
MNSQKCKLNFMSLQTNSATCYINFVGIMNYVHHTYNQFNLKFQPIPLYVVNKFLIVWYPNSQLHNIDFMICTILFDKERCITHAANTLFPRSNAQPHYTLKPTRLHTPTTLGLCCLLRISKLCL